MSKSFLYLFSHLFLTFLLYSHSVSDSQRANVGRTLSFPYIRYFMAYTISPSAHLRNWVPNAETILKYGSMVSLKPIPSLHLVQPPVKRGLAPWAGLSVKLKTVFLSLRKSSHRLALTLGPHHCPEVLLFYVQLSDETVLPPKSLPHIYLINLRL